MLRRSWPVFVRGKWVVWKPYPDLDPGLDESVYRLAAANWATAMVDGKPERQAHQEAEQFAFELAYGVVYNRSNSKRFGK